MLLYIDYAYRTYQIHIYTIALMYKSMEKEDLTFVGKIDIRGNIYVPKNIRELLEKKGDREKYFLVTIEKRE